MYGWPWVRCGVAPYIVHCSFVWKTRTATSGRLLHLIRRVNGS